MSAEPNETREPPDVSDERAAPLSDHDLREIVRSMSKAGLISERERAVWRSRAAIATFEKIGVELRTIGQSSCPPEAKLRIRTMLSLNRETVEILKRRLVDAEAELMRVRASNPGQPAT